MRPAAAPGAFADQPDSETRRQPPEPEAAATAVSMGAGVAEALGALDPELAGQVEAGLDREFASRVAGGFGSGFTGWVAGVFRAGFYVTGERGAIFAVLGPGSWPGPLHLVTASLPGLPVAGDRVVVAETTLAAGRVEIDFGNARLWDSVLPDRLGFDTAVWAGAAPPVEPDLALVWNEAAAAVRSGDLASACRLLEGRGGGLTPTGDDALAGIMLVAASDRARRPALRQLARQTRTSDLSRAFLEWSARGSSIQPAHDVLEAAASADRAGLARAAQTLSGVGASSGRALLTGLTLAALSLPPSPARLPRPLSLAHSAHLLRPAATGSSPA